MQKQQKTARELKELLDRKIGKYSLGTSPNRQWIKIVPADPAAAGANWRVAHSGVPGELAEAIDKAGPKLQQAYDLVAEKE